MQSIFDGSLPFKQKVETMTLVELFFGKSSNEKFSKEDWSALGKGEIMDEDVIARMLSSGYDSLKESPYA